MVDFESTLKLARSLPLADRIRLAEQLLEEAKAESGADELATGQRGLESWTESTRDEDWSEHYPASLRKRKVG